MLDTTRFQDFLDSHVGQGTAPGLQGVVFNRDKILFSGFSGLRSVGTESQPALPMTRYTHHWMASCSKLVISIMLFRALEEGYGHRQGITVDSLDDHDALVKVLPEFKHGSGSNVTKIITGFSLNKDKDGRRIPILRQSTNKVTLRQLLTHTSGLAYQWIHPLMKEWYEPSDGSLPNGLPPLTSGRIADFEVPLICEGGHHYAYGPSTDWIGQFIVRLTGKNLRSAFFDLVARPLKMSATAIDIMPTRLMQANGDKFECAVPVIRLVGDPNLDNSAFKSGLIEKIAKTEPPKGAFLQIEVPLYEPQEDQPPAGFAHFASAPLHASLESFAKILQATLAKDERLLSNSTWELIQSDDTSPRGVYLNETNMPSHMRNLSNEIRQYFDIDAEIHVQHEIDRSAGQNLLQCYVACVGTKNGLSKGSFSWAGLGNTYYFIDPVKGVGGIFGTQLLPFYDARMIQARYEWEELITSWYE